MNAQKFTQKSLEAVQLAQDIALERGNMQIEPAHLLAALLAHPGPVMLSGYDNELYNDTLKGWDKLHHKAQSECGGARTETLWLNYEPQETLFLKEAEHEANSV